MAKAKDGSECYTRTNKSGGKYVTCEGTQKSSKMSVNKKVTLEQQKRAQKRKKDREAAAKADKAIKEASDRIKKKKAQAKPKPKAKVPAIKVVKGTKKSIDLSPTESEVQTTTKDFYKLAANRGEAHIDEIDKKGRYMKRTLVKTDNLYDSLVNIVEKRGYSFSKPQLKNLRGGERYSMDPNHWGYGHSWHISESKGKTDMLIIYMSLHEFGAGATSIRVKKKK